MACTNLVYPRGTVAVIHVTSRCLTYYTVFSIIDDVEEEVKVGSEHETSVDAENEQEE
jgi:hypothetical protein